MENQHCHQVCAAKAEAPEILSARVFCAQRADGYEALVAGRWISVPQDKILRGITNPTGRAVVCARPEETILCFVTPDET